jgi:hypothetical protein
MFFVRIRITRILGCTGCCCLFEVGILRIFLSESGCPGLEDFQDVIVLLSIKYTDFGMIDKLSVKLSLVNS